MKGRPGSLVLEDGMRYPGTLFGPPASGEVVFTTAMTGYPEVVTDPSYRDQIVVMCFPMIGIYGRTDSELESAGPQVSGLVVRELFDRNVASGSIARYLLDHDRPILTGIDTRSLVRHLRSRGTLLGRLEEPGGTGEFSATPTEEMILSVATPVAKMVSEGTGQRIVVVDYGVKYDILRELAKYDLNVRLVPPTATAREIAAEAPDAVILSPGPGDPADLLAWTREVREIAANHRVFGICLGHQLLAQAFGAKTYKLKFGHRGGNHPVAQTEAHRVHITSQNHGYAVDGESLHGTGFSVTHLNANDRTVEGLAHLDLPIQSLQYHPEAGPGPHDERPAFLRVLNAIGVNVRA